MGYNENEHSAIFPKVEATIFNIFKMLNCFGIFKDRYYVIMKFKIIILGVSKKLSVRVFQWMAWDELLEL